MPVDEFLSRALRHTATGLPNVPYLHLRELRDSDFIASHGPTEFPYPPHLARQGPEMATDGANTARSTDGARLDRDAPVAYRARASVVLLRDITERQVSKLFAFLGANLGGWLGWWLGAHVGTMTAFVVSMIGTGAGVYAGRRLAREYLG